MALRWENPASTTHSLTPRTENRPLFFGILTPCKKPGATGSAGRCEPGCGAVHRPTPFHLLFFHTSVLLVNVWVMCAAQDSPQPRPLRGEKHPFPSRSSCASMRCLCRPNWVCFFFSAFPQFLASTSLEWRQNQFSLSWGLTAAPGFAHNRLTRLQQGRQPVSLVLLPYLAPKTAHRPSRGRIHFFSPERVYPPPLGGGAGYLLSWVRRVCPARSKLTHTGPTGLV